MHAMDKFVRRSRAEQARADDSESPRKNAALAGARVWRTSGLSQALALLVQRNVSIQR